MTFFTNQDKSITFFENCMKMKNNWNGEGVARDRPLFTSGIQNNEIILQ